MIDINTLLKYFEESEDGSTLRFLDSNGKQRFSISPKGCAAGNHDANEDGTWVNENCFYFDGPVGMGTAINLTTDINERKDLSALGAAPMTSRLAIEHYGQVLMQLWPADSNNSDNFESYGIIINSADGHRNGKVVLLRLDGINIPSNNVENIISRIFGDPTQVTFSYPNESLLNPIVDLYEAEAARLGQTTHKAAICYGRCISDYQDDTDKQGDNLQYYIDKHLKEIGQ